MSDICDVDCECDEGECRVGQAFAFGVTYGMMLAGGSRGDE